MDAADLFEEVDISSLSPKRIRPQESAETEPPPMGATAGVLGSSENRSPADSESVALKDAGPVTSKETETEQHSLTSAETAATPRVIEEQPESTGAVEGQAEERENVDTAKTSPRETAVATNSAEIIEKYPLILNVLCVAFHHRNGPQVEYAFPPFPEMVQKEEREADGSRPAIELPEEWSFLPFLCLPDGAHASEEEFIYFHLPPVPKWKNYHQSTLFGLACFRQIPASELLITSADVTRSTVQKAVVVLATKAVLGSVRVKLSLTTQALFAQRDFTRMDILENLYESLYCSTLGPVSDANLYTGISLRELVNKFKQKSLQLFKLLLLEKRVLFYGCKVERLSSYQYSLISLIPDLLRNLKDVGSPLLSCHPPEAMDHGVSTDASKEKLKKYGLPLRIFGEGSFFQPYIPLQQIEVLMTPTTKSFLVGTSNAIFTHHKACAIDAVVNVDNGTIEFNDSPLCSALTLTGADKRFMEEIVKSVVSTWSQEDDPSLNQQIEFEGSDEDIRARFENYLYSFLASVKYTNHAQDATLGSNGESGTLAPAPVKVRDVISDFGSTWTKLWQQTENFKRWEEQTTNELLENAHMGHPKEGTSTYAILSQRLQALGSSMSSSASSSSSTAAAAATTPAPTTTAASAAAAPTTGSTISVAIGSPSTASAGLAIPGAVEDRAYQTTSSTLSRSLPSASTLFAGVSGWMNQRKRERSSNSTNSALGNGNASASTSSTIPRSVGGVVGTEDEETDDKNCSGANLLDVESFSRISLSD